MRYRIYIPIMSVTRVDSNGEKQTIPTCLDVCPSVEVAQDRINVRERLLHSSSNPPAATYSTVVDKIIDINGDFEEYAPVYEVTVTKVVTMEHTFTVHDALDEDEAELDAVDRQAPEHDWDYDYGLVDEDYTVDDVIEIE